MSGEPDAAPVGGARALDQAGRLEARDAPDMPGAEIRSRSASSEAVMPGCRLICDQQRDLAAGDAERLGLAPQLAREAEEHRPKPVRESRGVRASRTFTM